MCHNLKDREINNFLFLTVVAFIKAICSHWNVCHFNTCKRNISLLQRKSTLSTSLITNTTKMLKKNTQCKSNLVVLCLCGRVRNREPNFIPNFACGLKPEPLLVLQITVSKLPGLVVGHQGLRFCGLRIYFEILDHKGRFGE